MVGDDRVEGVGDTPGAQLVRTAGCATAPPVLHAVDHRHVHLPAGGAVSSGLHRQAGYQRPGLHGRVGVDLEFVAAVVVHNVHGILNHQNRLEHIDHTAVCRREWNRRAGLHFANGQPVNEELSALVVIIGVSAHPQPNTIHLERCGHSKLEARPCIGLCVDVAADIRPSFSAILRKLCVQATISVVNSFCPQRQLRGN